MITSLAYACSMFLSIWLSSLCHSLSSNLLVNPDAMLCVISCLPSPYDSKENLCCLLSSSTFLRKEKSGKTNCIVKSAKVERSGSNNGTDLLPKLKDWLSQAPSTVGFKELKTHRAGLWLKKLWLNAKNVQTYSDKISTLSFYFIIVRFWSCTGIRSTASKHPPDIMVLFWGFICPIAPCLQISCILGFLLPDGQDFTNGNALEERWRAVGGTLEY